MAFRSLGRCCTRQISSDGTVAPQAGTLVSLHTVEANMAQLNEWQSMPLLLTIREVCEILRIGKSHAHNQIGRAHV